MYRLTRSAWLRESVHRVNQEPWRKFDILFHLYLCSGHKPFSFEGDAACARRCLVFTVWYNFVVTVGPSGKPSSTRLNCIDTHRRPFGILIKDGRHICVYKLKHFFIISQQSPTQQTHVHCTIRALSSNRNTAYVRYHTSLEASIYCLLYVHEVWTYTVELVRIQ